MSKRIIGSVANLFVQETQLQYQARIDTGAVLSSIHAYHIVIEADSMNPMTQNKGKMLWFTSSNHLNQQARVHARIIDITMIRSVMGMEPRYIVELHIDNQLVLASLKNRQEMDYKLLIGRNWLEGKYRDVLKHFKIYPENAIKTRLDLAKLFLFGKIVSFALYILYSFEHCRDKSTFIGAYQHMSVLELSMQHQLS